MRADDKKIDLNQWAKSGFKTEPVQVPCLACQMEAGNSKASLKKPLPEHGRTIHYAVPVLSWVCDLTLPDAAFLIDKSWLVKLQVYERVCVTYLSVFFLVIYLH